MSKVTVTVSNPTILNMLLTEVIGTIESESGMDALLQQGCDANFIDLMRRRPARDLMDVACHLKHLRFEVSVSEIEQQFLRLDWMRRDTALCEYFVKNGASAQMINTLFKKSTEEVRRLREALVPTGGANVGRTALPKDPKVREEIQQAWSEICKGRGSEESIRDRLYALHQRFEDHSIATLYSTIHEFEDDRSIRAGGGRESATADQIRVRQARVTS